MKTWEKLKIGEIGFEKHWQRETVIDTIRHFFKSEGFHEVFTPTLVPVPSAEANLEVFETQLRTARGEKRKGFLIMSPEYALKKLVAAGSGSVFEITRSFRNEEEITAMHNPEFTMLEWYRVGADYRKVMEDFENLFCEIVQKVRPGADLSSWVYQGQTYDLRKPWLRMSVAEVFERMAEVDTETMLSPDLLRDELKKRGYVNNPDTTWEQMFYQVVFNEIEPKLREMYRPVFVYDYPLAQAALARKKQSDPRFAERFEVFLAGIELGNCFSELTDAAEQRARLTEENAQRRAAGKTDYPVDEDFLAALEAGMPEVSGIAVGVDRLVMLAANAKSVSETLFFPAEEIFNLD